MNFECTGPLRIEQRTNGLGELFASVATTYEGYCATVRVFEGVAVLATPENSKERMILMAPSMQWIDDLKAQGWIIHETLISGDNTKSQ